MAPRPWGAARDLTRSELLRKIVHVGCGGFAFLLRDLTTLQAAGMAVAAFLFNWQVLPRIGGRRLWRGDDHVQGYPRGILIYPLAVLAVILYFADAPWMAAALWGVLAFGDGMASFVGQSVGGPRLPWNRSKGWAGFLGFVVFGTLGTAVLIAWTSRLPFFASAWYWPRTLGLALALNLVCALVESLPTTLDDNLTVPLVGALTLPLLAQADLALAASDPGLPGRALLGLALNVAVALCRDGRGLDRSGRGPLGRPHRHRDHRRPGPRRASRSWSRSSCSGAWPRGSATA